MLFEVHDNICATRKLEKSGGELASILVCGVMEKMRWMLSRKKKRIVKGRARTSMENRKARLW